MERVNEYLLVQSRAAHDLDFVSHAHKKYVCRVEMILSFPNIVRL